MTKPVEEGMQLPWEKGLLDYVVKLAKTSRRKIKFVILDGSAAERKDRKGSDYDVVVVKMGRDKRWNRPIELCGVFRRRVVSGWLVARARTHARTRFTRILLGHLCGRPQHCIVGCRHQQD
jgi:predicted nucleotidyltransferase